jgi:hypothetical protein
MMNNQGEERYVNNGFLAQALNTNNSRWTTNINNTNKEKVLRILSTQEATGDFCYFCWYYVTIKSNVTGNQKYRIVISNLDTAGDETKQVNIGQTEKITLPSTGASQQRKFLLTSKDFFTINVAVASGKVEAIVGTLTQNNLWSGTSSIGTISIKVRQTDTNF